MASVVGALISADAASNNAAAASEAAALQYQIADRIQKRLDKLFNVWETEYLACELALKNSVCNLTDYVVQYKTAANRAASDVRKQFTRARADAQKCLPLNCVGASCGIDRALDVAEAGALAWASQAAIRGEDSRKLVHDQMVRSEQYRMVAFGRQHYMNANVEAGIAQQYGSISAAARQAASSASYGVGRFIQQALGGFSGPQRTTPAPVVQSQERPQTVTGGVDIYGQVEDYAFSNDPGFTITNETTIAPDLQGFTGYGDFVPNPGVRE